MKELAYSFVQFIVIVMAIITLAVSSAAVAQWAEPDAEQRIVVSQAQS